MTILNLPLSKLTHHQMMEFGYEIVNALNTVSYPPIKEIKEDFETKVKNFDKALKLPRLSLLTPRIDEANRKRNRAWSKLYSEVKNHLNDSDRNTAAAADDAYLILQTYGSPNNMDRKEKSGIIRNLLEDFKTKLEPGDDELIHIKRWLEELDHWNLEYTTLFTQRRDNRATYPKGESQHTRKQSEQAYRQLKEWLNVESRKPNNEHTTNLQKLTDNINKVIADYRYLINQRTAQANAHKSPPPTEPEIPEPEEKNME